MSKVGVSILMSIFILVGCGNNSEENEVAILENQKWIDEKCQFPGLIDENGIVSYKDIFKFNEVDNKISIERENYRDTNCTDLVYINTSKEYWTYYDLGIETTQNDYDIHNMSLEYLPGSVAIDDIKNGISKDAHYAISHNRVCFSESFFAKPMEILSTNIDSNGNVYTIAIENFYIDNTLNKTDEIDFLHCLVKK